VKKCPELLQTNKSGVPSKLEFSSLLNENWGHADLIFLYNFASGPIGFSE